MNYTDLSAFFTSGCRVLSRVLLYTLGTICDYKTSPSKSLPHEEFRGYIIQAFSVAHKASLSFRFCLASVEKLCMKDSLLF